MLAIILFTIIIILELSLRQGLEGDKEEGGIRRKHRWGEERFESQLQCPGCKGAWVTCSSRVADDIQRTIVLWELSI